MNSDLYIGRLVLEIPGLVPEDSRALAQLVGEGLAGRFGADLGRASYGNLLVSLDAGELDASPDLPRLAQRIVHSLAEQIG